MTTLAWRETDFAGVVLAGLIAGYVMLISGLWAGRVRGFVTLDIADFGRRYIVSDRPSAWFFGVLSHLANSVLLTLVWATLVQPNLPWPRWLAGPAFGVFLAVVFAGVLVTPIAGLGFMGRKAGGTAFALTNLGVHLVWGVLVGLIYVPS